VRNAVRQPPLRFNTLDEALQRISRQFHIPIATWVAKSKLISEAKTQRKITQYA
jgi:hypothetical protein